MRRETGKGYEVNVFDDKDVANHIDLEPSCGAREGVSEASAEECAGYSTVVQARKATRGRRGLLRDPTGNIIWVTGGFCLG